MLGITGNIFGKGRIATLRLAMTLSLAGGLLLWYALCLPRDLFKGVTYSTVVNSAEGELLGARTAADGQWRFPPADSVPDKYVQCLVQFEDRHFRWHLGVDPVAMCRAMWQNVKSGHVVSGGSTITMQVIRMSRRRERTVGQKLTEMILATRLELRYSKKKILALYASHAPFGGNVVGIRAASWRYFGHPCEELSWAEAATLAVLPNSPSLMHIGKNRDLLLDKRNRLLDRLLQKDIIDSLTWELACAEPLPDKPLALPSLAFHLVENEHSAHTGEEVNTGIKFSIQRGVESLAERHRDELSTQGINDLAAVVVDIRTGEIIAYVGNAGGSDRPGAMVDIAASPRSTGSVLKPFLYAAALQEGELLPHSLLPDVPLYLGGFTPQNFDLQFSGAVKASEALARSLNVPFVNVLRNYGVPRFQKLLQDLGMSTLTRSADNYGLSLILGGAEGKLVELTEIYARLAAWCLYDVGSEPVINDKCALRYTFDAMQELTRPDGSDWKMLTSSQRIAWKTGTSFGFRDGWAIGVSPDYAVGVWTGNADGRPASGLTGARTAGPVMFDIFSLLPRRTLRWQEDFSEHIELEVCAESGYLAGPYCTHIDTLSLPAGAAKAEACKYHRAVRVTSDERYRVDAPVPGSHIKNMFILPPAMEWFYRQNHPEYESLPPLMPGTVAASGTFVPMQFIYPEPGCTLYLPVQLDGTPGEAVFHLAHSTPSTTVHWYLDSSFIGSTKDIHQFALRPEPGHHSVTVTDAFGNSISLPFRVEE